MTNKEPITKPEEKPNVFWGVLLERTLLGHAVDSLLDISHVNAHYGYTRISIPYMRTDMARNRMAASFLEVSRSSNDVLVMLDGDHIHPADVVTRLVCYDPEQVGVIGALYFRRGKPYDPLFFQRFEDSGGLLNPAEWEDGMVYQCTAVATGAIAIRRWVFEKLDAAGLGFPYFQYEYPENSDFSMTEDIFFALQCEKAGIPHFCDTSIQTPHLTVKTITKDDWDKYREENPNATRVLQIKDKEEKENNYDSSRND